MARAARLVLIGVAALLLLLIVWEAFALIRAKQRTPEVLRQMQKGELSLSDLSARRKAMLLKVEDPGFYRHHGVDFSTPGQGATSLTQGLVKHFYFPGGFRPGFAKIEQTLIARFVLDPAASKDEQLRAYLNYTYFGRGSGRPVIGYAAASRRFFSKPFRNLDDEQFLSLLAMTIAPNELDPIHHAAANRERVKRIERLLAGRCAPDGVRDVVLAACS